MSTHSCIMLKVRKSDIGKKVKFDDTKVSVAEWVDGAKIGEKSKEICLSNDYIGVYCHWDGYLDGVGNILKRVFNTYEKVLNLIIGGDISYLAQDTICHYANRKGEEWEWIQPKQGNTQKDIIGKIDSEYAYLFDEERGGWLYKETRGKNANKNGFKIY